MNVRFTIHSNWLIHSALSSYQNVHPTIVAFKNLAWKQSRKLYHHFIGVVSPDALNDKSIKTNGKQLPAFLASLKQSGEYRNLYRETTQFLRACKNQWDTNAKKTQEIIRNITGIKPDKAVTVLIVHPHLKRGRYLGDFCIEWGCEEQWNNYATVYIWHEILHAYFGETDLDHALIQFIADNELRVRLNGGTYPPFEGHKNLIPLMKKSFPFWNKYLKSKKRNISTFRDKMAEKFKKQAQRLSFHIP